MTFHKIQAMTAGKTASLEWVWRFDPAARLKIQFPMSPNTPISELTIGELTQIIARVVSLELQRRPSTVRGISGLAELFGVSESTAKRIKASGIIDKAISQSGKVIVTDAALALELYSKATHGRRNQ